MRMKSLIFAVFATASSSSVFAQDGQTNPSVTHLMQSYKLDKAEAQKRIDLQAEILALSERLNTESDAAYADMFIQHEPVFKIIISFADQSDRKAFLETIDPKLRRYVQLKVAKKSRGVFTRELEELAVVLRPLTFPLTSKYDLETEKFIITVETQEAATRVTALLPATRKVETVVNVAPVPKIQAAPTGVQPGDRLSGGNPVFEDAGLVGWCSLGYAVTYTFNGAARRGIVTAGHCANTSFIDFGGRNVTLSAPDVERRHRTTPPSGFPVGDGINDKYDYQIFEVTGLTVDNTIAYKDINSIPEFADTGTLRMTGITTFLNQKAGMVVCKSGHTTGITCGEITNGNLTRDGATGWIEVSKSRQRLISDGGDSGGPWFLYPGTSSTITGVGIHSAGNGVAGLTGTATYMPIDYIDDHIASVNTIKQ